MGNKILMLFIFLTNFMALMPVIAQPAQDLEKETKIKWEEIDPVYLAGDYEKALEMYKEFIKAYPSSEYSNWAKARIEFIEKDAVYNWETSNLFSKAIRLRNEALHSDPTTGGRKPNYKELYQEALELFQKIEKEYPNSSLVPDARKLSVQCYEGLGRYKEALEIYKETGKDDPRFYDKIGDLYWAMKEYDKAIESFKKYLKENSDLSIMDRQLAQSAIERIYYEQKKYDLYKEELFKRIKEDPTGPEARYAHSELMNLYWELKEYDNLVKECQKIVRKFPGEMAANALGNLAFYYLYIKDPPDPETAYKYLVKLIKEYPESNWAKNKESDYKELREKFGEKEYEYPEFTPMKEELSIGESVDEEKPLTKKKTGALNIKHILLIIIGALVLLGLFFVRSKVKKR